MLLLPNSLLPLLCVALGASAQGTCKSQSLPNPIASQYPQNVTGTLNGTLVILPIPMALARSMIPAKYNILTSAYRTLLPTLPEGMYPAFLQAVYDHDVGLGDYKIADFSRGSIEFPFIDLLSDNKTPFRWVPDMFLTSTNGLGINASREYGGEVYPATFEPACDAYAPIPSCKDGSTYFNAIAANTSLKATFSPVSARKGAQLPALFFKKVVNQPVFGDGKFCNAQRRMFNTSLSAGAYAPKAVSASVHVRLPTIFTQTPGGAVFWDDAMAMQVDTPFIEQHLVSCEGFRGYIWEDDSPVRKEEVLKAVGEEVWRMGSQGCFAKSGAYVGDFVGEI
ncbi:hypothetical protein EG328_002738 [Venturia inaequalis]|uniref:Uncharacterized protein n=2 Tax=Venturia inaequalis TaxID=5025 RepID=A0A8H3VJA3_VENIN|nr:hypothetical protein EG328_002738 [Venturia inaequalis]KAE9987919.1 hypothetical protein EG327_003605 [Venturia inaequalis]